MKLTIVRRVIITSLAFTLTASVLASALAFPPDDSPPTTDDKADISRLTVTIDLPELIDAHNQLRKEKDLPPFTLAPRLAEAARVHAIDMAQQNKMAHEGSDGSTPGQRVERAGYPLQTAGENLAMGYRSIEQVMDGWMNSPHHRDNILGEFTEIGAARVETEGEVAFWAVEFGTPWPELDPAAAAQELLDSINQYRTESKRPALKLDNRLSQVATAQAVLFAKRDSLQPTDGKKDSDPFAQIKKAGYRFRRVGIAHASGQPAASDVLDTWLEHENHRDQLLGAFTQAGIGHARGTTGKPFWTLILAQPLR